MVERVDVAIVGGGAIGLSVARELARSGVGRIVILERQEAAGQGSTARANGGVRAQFTSPINIAFSLQSIAEFERLHRDHGGLLSFHQVGYLFLTGTEEGEAGLRAARRIPAGARSGHRVGGAGRRRGPRSPGPTGRASGAARFIAGMASSTPTAWWKCSGRNVLRPGFPSGPGPQ